MCPFTPASCLALPLYINQSPSAEKQLNMDVLKHIFNKALYGPCFLWISVRLMQESTYVQVSLCTQLQTNPLSATETAAYWEVGLNTCLQCGIDCMLHIWGGGFQRLNNLGAQAPQTFNLTHAANSLRSFWKSPSSSLARVSKPTRCGSSRQVTSAVCAADWRQELLPLSAQISGGKVKA